MHWLYTEDMSRLLHIVVGEVAEPRSRTSYLYDDASRLSEVRFEDLSENRATRTVYGYRGALLVGEYYDAEADGKVDRHIAYIHDATGQRVATVIDSNNDGLADARMSHVWESGRLVKEGRPGDWLVYEYNTAGLLERAGWRREHTEDYNDWNEYSYDGGGRVVGRQSFEHDRVWVKGTIYDYDEEGRLVRLLREHHAYGRQVSDFEYSCVGGSKALGAGHPVISRFIGRVTVLALDSQASAVAPPYALQNRGDP